MNRSGFFFLVFSIVIAITFTWLNSSWLSYKGFVFDRQEKQIDYYLSDFSILNTYPDGSMRYLIKGQHLVHQQSTRASKIIKPTIEARDVDNSIITITANEAQQVKKNGPILLEGKVDVIKNSDNKDENFKLLTTDLSYNPNSREISTDAELFFTSSSGDLKGTGFSTKLDEQELRILKNVQAKFTPAK
ncbi:MAG: LPS export ABC transporter protein LptC [Cocleimonas sp.]|jgi:LPS export ABC transporter protein LptC